MGIAKTVNLSSSRKDGAARGAFACIAMSSARRGGTVGCSSLGRAETRAVSDNGRTKAHSALWGEAASATHSASIMPNETTASTARAEGANQVTIP